MWRCKPSNVTGGTPFVVLYKPAADGSASTSNGSITAGGMMSGTLWDGMTLPLNGTYTVFVDPQVTAIVSITETLWTVP